jgi:hypothetical protein
LGQTDFGAWYIAQELFCEVWLTIPDRCWGVRFTGKVVRFDEVGTGKPYGAAVLEDGDSEDLKGELTEEIYAALRKLRPSQSAFTGGEATTPPAGPAADIAGAATPKTLKLQILHPDAEAAGQLIAALDGVRLATANERADLVWDVVRGEVSRDQTAIAYPRTEEPGEVQLVVNASRLSDDIEDLEAEQADGLSVDLTPRQESYRSGDTVTLALAGHTAEYALVFNLGPYGDIDVIYPVEADFVNGGADWPRLTGGRPLSIAAAVGPPYGANLVVGVVSGSEPTVLLKTLLSGGGPAGLNAFLKALKDVDGQMAAASFRIER